MMTSLVYEVLICIEPHVDVSLCVLNYLEADIQLLLFIHTVHVLSLASS